MPWAGFDPESQYSVPFHSVPRVCPLTCRKLLCRGWYPVAFQRI